MLLYCFGTLLEGEGATRYPFPPLVCFSLEFVSTVVDKPVILDGIIMVQSSMS